MSYVIAAPELLAAASTDLQSIGSSLSRASAAASAPTTELLAAASDEVSAAITAVFSAHARDYQALSAHVAAFHERFVQALTRSGAAYAAAEAVGASSLQGVQQDVLGLINAPTLALLGRPLIGNGADGTTPGAAGGPAGCCTATAVMVPPG
ncbi:PE family protein [Mycobacterium kansasii 824]|nr:PE family protein [Mycobacterium kansasii 824]